MAWAFLEAILNSGSSVQAAELPENIELAARQQLVINNRSEVASLDPHQAMSVPENNVMRNLLEGLCNLDRHGETVPGVAERWEESVDGRTWTFYLRPTARWSNGEPVTAHDFVYSWHRLADRKTTSLNTSTLVDLKLVNSFAVISGHQPPTALGIKALDNHTLELYLSQPHPFLIKMLSSMSLYPLHRATVEKHGQQWTLPTHYVGNGAYRLQAWKINEKLVLTRNSHYWDHANTRIEQATLLAISSPTTELRRYRAGELDLGVHNAPDDNFRTLQQEFPQEVRLFPALDVSGVTFNNRRPPFQDVRIRRALALALDREALSSSNFMQVQKVAYTMIPDGTQGVEAKLPAWAHWPRAQRIQEAQKLLQAAGYNTKQPLCFSFLYNTQELNKQTALLLRAQWEENLPVKVTLENHEWKVFVESLRFGRYQVARFAWVADYNEPYALLRNLRSHSEMNAANYRSQKFDDCLEQVLRSTDNATRCRYYQRAEKQLEQDMPMLPLIHRVNFRLVKPYVGGLSSRNCMGAISIKDLYIMKQ